MEPAAETPTKPWIMWTVIGVVAFVALITFIGVYSPEPRPYIETASKWMLSIITSVKSL